MSDSALLEAVKVALGELYPSERLAPVRVWRRNGDLIVWRPTGTLPSEHVVKAKRLAIMQVEGTGVLVWCDAHVGNNRYDLWDCCAKVPVREALMGHVCGQP